MQTRELPATDWSRLSATYAAPFVPNLREGHARVLVVEDGEDIVGCWLLFRAWHVEGLWIREDHQKRGGVARRLFVGMKRWLTSVGAPAVWTGAVSEDVERLLAHVGAEEIKMKPYIWTLSPNQS